MRKILLTTIFLLTVGSIIHSCQSATEIELTTYITNGKDLYKIHCQNCHGEKGEGLGALAPPLNDTVFLKENKQKLSCIIKNGATEKMVINGKIYDGKMPAFQDLADIDIAQVIVYVTNSFGNRQGMYPYQQVTKDLGQCGQGMDNRSK
jgi:mono/diheme cytochrome c family protein